MQKSLGTRFFFIVALAYTAGLAYLSLIDLAGTAIAGMGMSDKLMHVGAYFLLVLLWTLFFLFYSEKEISGRKALIICLVSILFGIFIEVLQGMLTSYRQSDLYDILANSTGAIFAGILLRLFKKTFNQVKNKD